MTIIECVRCGGSLSGVDQYEDENLDFIYVCPHCGYENNEYEGLWSDEVA